MTVCRISKYALCARLSHWRRSKIACFPSQILRLGLGIAHCAGAAMRWFAAASHSSMLPPHVSQADRYHVAQNFASRRQKVGALSLRGLRTSCLRFSLLCLTLPVLYCSVAFAAVWAHDRSSEPGWR